MTKSIVGFVKGVGTGIAAGMVVGAVGSRMMGKNKHFKKRAGKAMGAVGDFIDNVQYMMK